LKTWTFIIQIFLIYLALSVGCFLLLRIILEYTSFKDNVQFLAYKQAYVHDSIWRKAFYTHVFSAIIALLAGFTQFSKDFLKNHKKLHRLFGKIYVWDILAVNVPAGMILAVCANGMLPGRIAFVLLDSLWFWFTYRALRSALDRNFTNHKNYMIRSYALTFSAVTLRTWRLILSTAFTIDPVHLYMIDAWMGFVPNLLVAEYIIRAKKSQAVTG